ncbi:replication factor C subunit 1 [Prorops nasuta]|uniref:replication factor C subunit 1 n=1 Tax=Prorops nasuta TaxID=863751 RepID=UPI0034CF501A
MPKDIRSYFTNAISSKPKASGPITKNKRCRVISSDDEDSAEQSPIKKSKGIVQLVASNSDDDDCLDVTPDSIKAKHKSKELPKKKSVSISDIFGKTPVKRQQVLKTNKKLQKQEAEWHNDTEFEATLVQLDNSKIELTGINDNGKKIDKNAKSPNTSGDKNTKSPKKSGDKNIKSPNKLEDKDTKSHKLNQKRGDKSPEKTKKNSINNVETEQKEKDNNDNKSNANDFNERKRKHASHDLKESANQDSSTSSSIDKSPAKKLLNSKRGSKISSKLEIEDQKVKKLSPTKSNDQLDPYDERILKKKQRAVAYQQYLHRGGARNPGSKPIPEGAELCLAGLTFVVSGVFESLERDEVQELIKKYGGRVVASVSRKTNYLVVGEEAGQSKLLKAKELHVKILSEDDLLELIKTRPQGKASAIIPFHTKSNKKHDTSIEIQETSMKEEQPLNEKNKLVEEKDIKKTVKKALKEFETNESLNKKDDKIGKLINEHQVNITHSMTEALVDKYRPKSIKQLIGQQTEKSSAKKLYAWLQNWYKNQYSKIKPSKPSPYALNNDGAFFKAALLSGPPGVGKTTSVQVACKELGFDLIEFNASDTRSKKLLKEEVSEILFNTTVKEFFKDKGNKPSKKHALLMDEVDGMAGNEDRGGLQELISLIKSSDVPIICICNDRNHPKMRTLSNYTFDLRFPKPRLEQIRGAMKSICFKENIKISNEDLDRLIVATNLDVRQVINHLSLYTTGFSESQTNSEGKCINKDIKLGPWDVVHKVFSADEHKNMSIHDKSSLFFHDYNIAPLFVQENYLSVIPKAPKEELLEKVALSADSIAVGAMIEKKIRGASAWSLLPVQAIFSSVIPGTLMSGIMNHNRINFPSWLGKNSRSNKFDRMRQEITVHTRLTTGASKEAINLDYLGPLKNAILRPLIVDNLDGVDKAVKVMNEYHLVREDLDSIAEISLWSGDRDPMQAIPTKVKAAFTRAYNKSSTAMPYTVKGSSKKKNSQDEELMDEEDNANNEEEEEDTIEADKMIKAKNPTVIKTGGGSKKKEPSTSKASRSKRGRGRGKC